MSTIKAPRRVVRVKLAEETGITSDQTRDTATDAKTEVLTEQTESVSSIDARQAITAEIEALLADSERLKDQLSLLSQRCDSQPFTASEGIVVPRLSFALFAADQTCVQLKALSAKLGDMNAHPNQATDVVEKRETDELVRSADSQDPVEQGAQGQLPGAGRALAPIEVASMDNNATKLNIEHEQSVTNPVEGYGDPNDVAEEVSPNDSHFKHEVVNDPENTNESSSEPVEESASVASITDGVVHMQLHSPPEPSRIEDHVVPAEQISVAMQILQEEIKHFRDNPCGRLGGIQSCINTDMIDNELHKAIAERMHWTPFDRQGRTIACLMQSQTEQCMFAMSGFREITFTNDVQGVVDRKTHIKLVRKLARDLDFDIPPEPACDQGVPGQYHCCHAEAQLLAYWIQNNAVAKARLERMKGLSHNQKLLVEFEDDLQPAEVHINQPFPTPISEGGSCNVCIAFYEAAARPLKLTVHISVIDASGVYLAGSWDRGVRLFPASITQYSPVARNIVFSGPVSRRHVRRPSTVTLMSVSVVA